MIAILASLTSELTVRADDRIADAATLLVATLIVALVAESEALRARKSAGAPLGRGWVAALAPLAVLFAAIVVLRFTRIV